MHHLQGLGGPAPPPPEEERDFIEKHGSTFFIGMMLFSVVFFVYYAPDRIQTWVRLAQDLHGSYFPAPPKDPMYFPSTKEQEIVLPSAETMGLYEGSPPPPSPPGEEEATRTDEPEPLNPMLDKGFSRGKLSLPACNADEYLLPTRAESLTCYKSSRMMMSLQVGSWIPKLESGCPTQTGTLK